jgi:hypothetical protein
MIEWYTGYMGIFDSFLGDIQRDIRRATNGVEVIKSGARKVVEAIDTVEEKVNNLPSEADVKKKIKQELAGAKKVVKDSKPAS